MCVLSLNVMEFLSCCSGRLWARPCIVFQLVLVFLLWSHGLSVCSLQISVLFVLMRVDISLLLRYSGILWRVFSCVLFCCVCVVVGVCVANPAYWYVFLACLVKYVGECLVCVMYVCRWLYCSEGVFCVLCEFVPVCLPVVSV